MYLMGCNERLQPADVVITVLVAKGQFTLGCGADNFSMPLDVTHYDALYLYN